MGFALKALLAKHLLQLLHPRARGALGFDSAAVSRLLLFVQDAELPSPPTSPGAVAPSPTYAMLALISEITGHQHRGRFNVYSEALFVAATCIQPAIGYLVPAWREHALVLAAASVAFGGTWPLLLESPRWLLSRGRGTEAMAVLLRIARWNGWRDEEAARKLISARLEGGGADGGDEGRLGALGRSSWWGFCVLWPPLDGRGCWKIGSKSRAAVGDPLVSRGGVLEMQ